MKLFMSLYKTIVGVASGAVTAEDLKTGLFYFSCSQNVVLNPHWASLTDEEARIEARLGQPQAHAHAVVVDAVLAAVVDGRATWWVPGKPMSFDSVNAMLRRVGLGEIVGYDGRPTRAWQPNGEGFKARLDERNIPVEVIF